jgi:type IV pilus assembly protein PilM
LSAELHNSILLAPTSLGSLTDPAAAEDLRAFAAAALSEPVHGNTLADEGIAAEPLPEDVFASEVAQAVSVAAAYYEDSLAVMPENVLCAGSLGADALKGILQAQGIAERESLRVRELVRAEDLAVEAVSSKVSRGWLAGVLGALRG